MRPDTVERASAGEFDDIAFRYSGDGIAETNILFWPDHFNRLARLRRGRS
jgi:hypothetical protein